MKDFTILHKENNGKGAKNFSTEYKAALRRKYWSIWLVVWLFLGLLSPQWDVFGILLFSQLLIIAPISKRLEFTTTERKAPRL